MAKGQPTGNATTIGMIVFAALWLTATVFLVILYTDQSALTSDNARVNSRNATLISAAEERALELVKSAREGGPTVVGLIEEARSRTAELATGTPGDTAAAVKAKRDQLLAAIRGDNVIQGASTFENLSLYDALSRLYTACKAEADLRKAAENRALQLDGEMTKLVEADVARRNEFDQRTKETADKLARCDTDRGSFRDQSDEAVRRLEGELDETKRRSTAELTNERRLRLAAEQKLAELQERFSTQQEKLGGLLIGPEELSTARKADGHILTAVPGDKVVYIDLGAKDTLTLGLQFAVYSAQTGIPADGRGKAQVEVVSIHPSSAECRIVWRAPTAVILEGDLIANPVYDPARAPTFLVLGEFDLDRDGILDRGGSSSIEALIGNWGGKITKELTPLTDFVVLGAPPKKPRISSDGTVTTPASVQTEWDRYNSLAEAARSMSVPVMTQNVFLNFLGYTR